MAELQVQDKVAKEQVYVIEDLERPFARKKASWTSEADKQTWQPEQWWLQE